MAASARMTKRKHGLLLLPLDASVRTELWDSMDHLIRAGARLLAGPSSRAHQAVSDAAQLAESGTPGALALDTVAEIGCLGGSQNVLLVGCHPAAPFL